MNDYGTAADGEPRVRVSQCDVPLDEYTWSRVVSIARQFDADHPDLSPSEAFWRAYEDIVVEEPANIVVSGESKGPEDVFGADALVDEGKLRTDGGHTRRETLHAAGALAFGGLGSIVPTTDADGDEPGDAVDMECVMCAAGLEPVADGLRCPECDITHPAERWDLFRRDFNLGTDEIQGHMDVEVPTEVLDVVRDRVAHARKQGSVEFGSQTIDLADAGAEDYLLDYLTFSITWRHAETGEVLIDGR